MMLITLEKNLWKLKAFIVCDFVASFTSLRTDITRQVSVFKMLLVKGVKFTFQTHNKLP